jgi:hypothetical protein
MRKSATDLKHIDLYGLEANLDTLKHNLRRTWRMGLRPVRKALVSRCNETLWRLNGAICGVNQWHGISVKLHETEKKEREACAVQRELERMESEGGPAAQAVQ